MKTLQVAYVPVGVGTFHLESAQKEFEDSVALLTKIQKENFPEGNAEFVFPKEMLLTLDLLKEYLDGLSPDLIFFQNVTFANAAYASEVMHAFTEVPVLLWTLREPVIDGGRLRLNSLTGAYSAANTFRRVQQKNVAYVFGGPQEEAVQKKIAAMVRAAAVRNDMRQMTLLAVGDTPQGFGFGRAQDADLLQSFGVHLLSVEARELMRMARAYTEEEGEASLQAVEKSMRGLEKTPEKNRMDFAKLVKAYTTYVKEHQIGAVASRCWPDFFTDYGTPVCAVLAVLNDAGVAASCEADAYGALSMYVGMRLTGEPSFFGDPVSMDEKENTITFWHCGTAACSLAREDTGAEVGVHCNRGIGPTLEFGCKEAEQVTIFRIGKDARGEFRFFIASGKALDRPKQFYGTSVVVQTEACAEEIVYRTVEDGWEPHYAVIYGDVAEELEALAHMLSMEVLRF